MKPTSTRPLVSRIVLAVGGLLLLTLASTPRAHWGVQEGPSEGRRMYPAARSGGNYMHNYYFPMAPSSNAMTPAWSPDGKWIAVSMGGSLWKVDPETGVAVELTYNNRNHALPDWSPDGKWIIYAADEDWHRIQLEILNVETGVSHALTDDDQIYVDPMFSPDGSMVAYVSTKPNGYFNVFIRPIRDGKWAGEEIAVTKDNSFGRSRLYFGEWDVHIQPEWTKDGKELLIVSNKGIALGSGDVWRVPAVANGFERAQHVLHEQSLYRTRPDISIDGKRFIYSSTRGSADQFANLYVLPVVGGEPWKMTYFAHDAFHPRWSPDGEWIAFTSNKGGVPHLALLETYGGKLKDPVTITKRQWKRPVGVISVRTTDEDGQTMYSRIHMTASDGKFYPPDNTYARVAQSSRESVFHIPGSFSTEVPVGRLTVEAVRGFEYWPAKAEVEIKEGDVTHVNLSLKRMTDMGAKGWYSGSTHMHMNYGGNLHNTLENLLLMSAAEDQDIANELVANKDNRFLDYQFWVPGGDAHPVSWPDRLIVVSEEYRPPFYGHVFLLGLKEHLITPGTTGYEQTGIESLYPSNTDIFRKAKAQGATTGYVHAFGGESDPLLSASLGQAKGFIVDAALDTTHGIEWSNSGRASFFPWYAVLNNGLRVTGTGGEDSMSDLHISKLVGAVRTYVYTGAQGLKARPWMDGLAKGHAFMSSGPLIELKVNNMIPGEDVSLPATGGTVDISVWVRSITPLDKVMLIGNGELVEEIPLSADRRSADWKKTIRVTRSGWFHLRAEGKPEDRYPLDTGFAQAFTTPVWVTVGNQPVRSLASAEYCIKWIDKLKELADAWPGWRSQKERDHVFAQFDEARKIYENFAKEAAAMRTTSTAAQQ
jgi:TolB protein